MTVGHQPARPTPAGPSEGARHGRAVLPVRYALALLASAMFSLAIVPGFGAYHPRAVAAVVAGLLLLLLVFGEHLRGRPALSVPAQAVLPLLWVAAVGLAWLGRDDPMPLMYPQGDWRLGRWVQTAALLLLFTYLPALLLPRLREGRAWRHTRFAVLAFGMAAAGVDVLRTAPLPLIDVWDMQQQGAAALAGGDNPYERVAVTNTAPGVSEDLPYLYPPLQVLVTLPAYLLGGDVRYAILAALLVAGVALRHVVRRVEALPAFAEDAPALFVWLTPKFWFLLEQSWIDPVQLALLCLAVAAYVTGRRRAAAVFFGLTSASKQISFWLAGLAAACLRLTLRQWLITIGVAVATVLPWLLLNPVALYEGAVAYVGRLPARPDALTLPNWAARSFGLPAEARLAFPLAATVVGLAAWRLRRSVAGFTAAAALTYAVFFAFNKFAFANYWFLVAGLSALAGAASLHSDEPLQSDEELHADEPERR